MRRDTDPRLLRAFVAVAEELHFTRAAARLFVAQQALSRDIGRLEREWGTALFARSTRHVRLTPEGERLLPYVRRLLAACDELRDAVGEGGERPLVVDVAGPVTTGQRVLAEARRTAPGLEFVARFHSGLAGAAAEIAGGRVDVSFGRVAGLAPALRAGLAHRLIRYERVAVLLPGDHPLAARETVPLSALAGETLYAGAGNQETTEWTDYARCLFAGRGIRLAAPFPKIEGEAEFVRVVRGRGWWVLASEEFVGVPGMALRRLTDPVPLSPVSLVWRRGLRHPGLAALTRAALGLAGAEGWLGRPPGHWLPEADRQLADANEDGGGQLRRASPAGSPAPRPGSGSPPAGAPSAGPPSG
ncbi:LysR family transcriptional regulator [Streptomyces hoynatensis]|uniref:LysR family transcriptional regulator n=1 Tax=Streptomyces hoynatensis TaxID=1141874 RepID=A0A3A9YW73_9ACTN|nr:LysR family transcriptional regulator [Streptomyces hoynatensis]RKN39864.1 LysR family transcriptional regulator [Streptomyces hoynatensis]